MPPREITELKDAIRATHGCESLHVESVPVKEVFEDQTRWEGTVEVFDLIGHLQAKRAYAWSYRDGNQNKTMAVLEIPPVDSPESASKSQSQANDGQIIDKNGTSCSNALFLATTPAVFVAPTTTSFLNETLPFGTSVAFSLGWYKKNLSGRR
jgi:hypothetical protein